MPRPVAWMTGLAIALASCAAKPLAERSKPVGWSSMSSQQKLGYMESTVTPRMSALFKEYDPHRFPRLTCKSCHGPDGARRRWVMPNPDLLLEETPWNTGATAPDAAPSELERFMASRVGPEMAKLLGRAHGSGPNAFGCFGCHTPER